MKQTKRHSATRAVPRRHSLATKQAVLTLLIALVMSMIAGLIEMYADARGMRTEIREQTQSLLALVTGTASEAAYQLNPDLADQVVDGVFDRGDIERVVLRDDFGRVMAERGRDDTEPESWLLQQMFGDLLVYQQPLQYDMVGHGIEEPVGEIELVLALDSIGESFMERSWLIFVLGVMKVFGIALFVVLAFYLLINRPLLKVYEAISEVDPTAPGSWPKPDLGGHKHDELGKLVSGLDRLLKAFQSGLDQRDELHQISTVDGLTGIANRRHFDAFLDEKWQQARRGQHEIGLIFMDIDNFKAFNDNYGHLAGDDCLRAVARTISESVPRATDLVARYGGEEFVCVLSHTDLAGAVDVAKRIQAAVLELDISHEFSDVHDQLTLSIGIASGIPDVSESSAETLLAVADHRLYQAKSGGRNSIVSTGEP